MFPTNRRFLALASLSLVVALGVTVAAQTQPEPDDIVQVQGAEGEANAAAEVEAAEVVTEGESEAAANSDGPHAEDRRSGFEESIDAVFATMVGWMMVVLFFNIPGIQAADGSGIPFIVAWLFLGAVVFTFWMRFINLQGFKHALLVVRGTFDDPEADGEVSHFQALSSALSATIGLGNIAGVAFAVSLGGPGAVFWMIVAALFGMTSKLVECTLGQKYRAIDEDGQVLGGPMRYLDVGLAKRGMPRLGKFLAVMFAVFCIGGSFGGGNMFQVNQAYLALDSVTPFHVSAPVFGIVMMVLVGIVILGGIRRIAATAEKIVPLMCGMYIVAALFVVFMNYDQIGYAIASIMSDAFSGEAMGGGLVGVMIMGIRRAAFSNEAGIGSAAIAHAAAKTKEPVREGLAAMLGPFIDTIVVCTTTGIVIVVSGVLDNPATASLEGATLTAAAFKTVISWFPVVLTGAIMLFAYSTMISWSYYGERCWTNLFGPKSTTAYRIVFLGFIFVGAVSNMSSVLDFSDLMILAMAFPNILGLYILAGEVRTDLDSYMSRIDTFKRFK